MHLARGQLKKDFQSFITGDDFLQPENQRTIGSQTDGMGSCLAIRRFW
jgi:hypothetical protein